MRSVSPLVVAALVALPASIPARAQHVAGHAAPAHVAPANNVMAQQQRAMEAQFKQQQKAMEAQVRNEQKVMQQQAAQQQKAMQHAAQQQQKAMQQQQHAAMQAVAHEQKAMALQPMKAAGLSNVGTDTGAATPNATHHTSASKTAHHTTHMTPTVHHITQWRTWPVSTSASYRHLESLKRHLDGIAMKSVPTASQKSGLRGALVNVIENSPHPASSHMQTFANHLADSVASRTNPAIDTRELALQLRVMVNNVHMTPVDLDATLVQHQALMLGSGVPATHVGVLSDDLRYLVNETQTKAMR